MRNGRNKRMKELMMNRRKEGRKQLMMNRRKEGKEGEFRSGDSIAQAIEYKLDLRSVQSLKQSATETGSDLIHLPPQKEPIGSLDRISPNASSKMCSSLGTY